MQKMINSLKRIIPILITVWVIFVMAMYCGSFVLPRLIEFINR